MPSTSGGINQVGVSQLFFGDDDFHRKLVKVSQHIPVLEVIQQLHQAESSCALVVEQETIIGIFTQRDVVRAIAESLNSQCLLPFTDVTVAQFMSQPVITLTEVEAQDISLIQQRFQEYDIGHLPVINNHGEILGVITPEAINAQARELQRREAECKQSQAKYAEILNTAIASAIVSLRVFPNYDWVCDYQSLGSEAIFGYTAEEIINNPNLWSSGIHPEDRETVILPLYQDIFASRTVSVEYRFYHKDGSLRWISATYNSRYVADAQCWIVTGTNFDITTRKQIEESLRHSEARLQNLAANLPGNIYTLVQSSDGSIWFEYLSCGIEQIIEATVDEVLENPRLCIDIIHPDDVTGYNEAVRQSYEQLSPFTHEWRIITPSGKLKWLQGNSMPERRDNGDVAWYGLVQDVSDRKQTEELLRHSEARFKHLAANLPGSIYTFVQCPDGSIHCEYVSYGVEKIYEITAEQLLEDAMLSINIIHPDDIAAYNEAVRHSYENLTPFSYEWRIITPSGKLKWIQANSMPELRSNGDVAWHGLGQDISESKQIEAALRDSEQRWQLAIAGTNEAIWDWDICTNITFRSDRWYEMLGYQRSQLSNSDDQWSSRIHPEDYEQVIAAQKAYLSRQVPEYHTEYRLRCHDSRYRWFQSRAKAVWDDQGNPLRLVGSLGDITDRKLAELELIHSRDLREAIFHKSTDALFLVDTTQYLIMECNNRAVELFEFSSKDQVIGIDGQTLQKQPFTPEQVAFIVETINQQGFWSGEIEYFTHKGNLFWGNLAVREITVAGEIIHLVRVTDISERKQAELALQEREAMLRGIGDNLHSGMVYQVTREFDGSYRFSYLSAGIEKLMEITAADVLQDHTILCRQFLEPDYLKLQTAIDQSSRDLCVFDLQLRIYTPSGRLKWLNFRCSPRLLHDGRLAWDGLAIDVTELKLHEARLEESQRVARLGNWEHDLTTGKITWSKTLFELFHRELAQLEPTFEELLQSFHPEDAVKLPAAIEKSMTTGESYKLILRVPQPQDSYRYIQAIGNVGCNAKGEVIRLYGTAQDITEQQMTLCELQKAEAALAKSEEQLRLTLEFTDIGTWDWNILTGEVIWNHNHYRLFGFEPQTIVPTYQVWRDAVHPDDIEKLEKAVLNSLSEKTSYELCEYRVIHPDGTVHWLTGRGRGIHNQAGEPIRMLGIIMDISDRKRAEQMLELQAVITRNIAEGICLIRESDGVIVYTNPKFDQMFGYDSGELIGQHIAIVNYETEEKTAIAVYQKIVAGIRQYGEFTYEVHNVKKDGTAFWCRGTSSIFRHHEYGKVFVAIQQDITQQKQADDKIRASLQEKEVLLQEIHHRVKNNLGIVSGLLQMQCRRTQDAQATAILRDSQNRIASIALVHEKLYRSEELADIDFAQYIPDLTTHLFDSYNVSSNQIKLIIQVENASLDIETAIPCGLIINELVSNALKYAFPEKLLGKIEVKFYQDMGGELILIVRDNGVGLPAEFDRTKTKTLGLTLVQGLVKQLRGDLDIKSEQGTEFKITFTNRNI
jgi:PAS domain S-box-containing protein